MARTTTSNPNENVPIELPKRSYQVYNILSKQNSMHSNCASVESEGSILVAVYNNTNGKRVNTLATCSTAQSFEMGNAWIEPTSPTRTESDVLTTRRTTLANSTMNTASGMKVMDERLRLNRQLSSQENVTTFSPSPFNTGHFSGVQSPTESTSGMRQSPGLSSSLSNSNDWSRLYLFGREHGTELPRIPRPP